MFHNTRFGRKIFQGDLQEGEEIIYVGHVHTIVLVKDILGYLILGVLLPYLFITSQEGILVLLGSAMALASFIRFYLKFLLWYFDCWVITEKGIIDYYWKNIFSKKVIRIDYDSIQGLAHEIKGFWNTVMNRGIIQVVQDDNEHDISLKNASNPKHIEQMILHAQKAHHLSHEVQKHANKQDQIHALLAEMLANYAKEKGIDLD